MRILVGVILSKAGLVIGCKCRMMISIGRSHQVTDVDQKLDLVSIIQDIPEMATICSLIPCDNRQVFAK